MGCVHSYTHATTSAAQAQAGLWVRPHHRCHIPAPRTRSQQAAGSGKPEAVVAKMVEGRLGKFYEESCLLEQRFFLDESVKVQGAVDRCGAEE